MNGLLTSPLATTRACNHFVRKEAQREKNVFIISEISSTHQVHIPETKGGEVVQTIILLRDHFWISP